MADLDFLGESFHKHALSLGYKEIKRRLSAFVLVAKKFPEFVYKRVKNMAHKEMALREGIVQFAPLFYYQRDEHSQARKDTTEGWVGFEPFFLWIPIDYVDWVEKQHKVKIFASKEIPVKQSQGGLYLLDKEHIKYVGKIPMIKVSITELLFSPLSIFCCSTEKKLSENLNQDFGQFVYKIHVRNFLKNLIPITPFDRSPIYTSIRTGEKLSTDRLLPIIDGCKVSYLQDGIHGKSVQHKHSMFLARAAYECRTIFRSNEMVEAMRVANSDFSLSAFKANLEKTINAHARAWACGAPNSAFVKREQFAAQKEFRFSISFADRNSKVYIRYPTRKIPYGSHLIPGGVIPPPNPFLLRIRNPEEVFFDV